MKRRTWALLASIVLSLSLAACGASVGNAPESATEENSAEETSVFSAAASEDVEAASDDAEAPSAQEEVPVSEEEPAANSEAEPAPVSETPTDEDVLSFTTVDLDGNEVDAATLFSQHRLTMVNLWGTYCPPCIREMPDLEVLNQRLAEKDCAIIGVVIDVWGSEDSATIQAAKDICSDTGVTYMSLLPWATLDRDMPLEFIPTTYFVDRSGRIVGEAAVGARGADDYEALVDAALLSLNE